MTSAPRQNLSARRRQIAALAAGVLLVHLLILLSSGAGIWRLQPESQKLGPLQTRVVSLGSDTAEATPEKLAGPKVTVPAPIRHSSPVTPQPTSAGLQAIASQALPAAPALPEMVETPVKPDEPTATNAALSPPPNPATETTVPSQVETASSATPPAVNNTNTNANANALNTKLGDFPSNVQINYRLTGQERGLSYHASGTLKWQTKAGTALPRAYEAELQVRAFLVGRRIWRSVGQLTDKGLAPLRYSDSWRGERAAHFEADAQKISFSGNTPSAPLQAGAQDQVSLFIQMAAAVAGQNFKMGSELNVQTATARDAVNWTLTYKSDDMIDLNGDRVESQRWVCLPRGKFDSQIEMWFVKSQGGLPVRIKITQVSGNFIDMEMRGSETLPALAD
ncbi:MAG: hypothetical protein RJB45_921 [Pseudomonadota bacterium]